MPTSHADPRDADPDADPTSDTGRRPSTTAHDTTAHDTDAHDTDALPGERRPALLPVWFEWGLVVVTAALVSVTGAGLLLALLGRYGLTSTLLWGALGTVVFSAFALRGSVRTREGSTATAPTVAMCVVALGSLAYNGLRAGHYVFVDRDPGVYAVAARWLARTGSLQVQAGAPWTSVSTTTSYASAGMYPESGGILEFQFNHLFAVLLAVAQGIGGDRVMFAANAVVGAVGLLAVYSVGVRLCQRPWLVVVACLALALSLPQLLFSRDTYSEPFTQLLLWSGMWLVLTAWERRRLGLAALGGLALGATVMVRVDALLYLGALPAVAGLIYVAVRRGADRRFAAAWAGTVLLFVIPPTLLGSIDVQVRSTGYYKALAGNVNGLRLALIASFVVGVLLVLIVPRLPRLASLTVRVRDRVAVGAGVATVVGLVVAWSLRPWLQHPTNVVNTTTAALQTEEGLDVAPKLTYAEDSMTWLTWYLGPLTVGLAVLGVGLLVAAAVRGRSAAVLVVATVGPASALYLYQVSNTPEQVWAVRRYIPNVLPLFVVAAVVAVEAIVVLVRLAPWKPVIARSVMAVAVVGFVVFPLGVLGPVRDFETQAGYLPAVDTTCDTLGPDAAVVFAFQELDGIVLSQTLRSFCGVPTTRFAQSPTPDQLAAVVQAARADGRTLWVLGTTEAQVVATVGTATAVQEIVNVTNDRKLETTLSRVPDRYEAQTMTVWGARVG